MSTEKITALEGQLRVAAENVEIQRAALKELTTAIKDPSKSAVFGIITTNVNEAEASLQKIEKALVAERAAEATAAFVDPLIAAVGVVEVKDVKNLPNKINLVDLETEIKKAEALAATAADRLAVFVKINDAVQEAAMGDDVVAGFRPLTLTSISPQRVKIEVSTRTRATGDGTGKRGGRNRRYEIIACEKDPGLVGQTYGWSEANYPSGREVLNHLDPEHFKLLEAKRASGSNYSAPGVLKTRYGVKSRELTPA